MNELRSVKTYFDLNTLSLNDQTKFRLNEINKIKYYFEFEITKREAISKKRSIAILDYMDKVLIVLSATSGGVSIISHANIIGIPAAIISSSFTLVFSLTTEIIKKLLKETRKKKKKHSKIIMIIMLTKSKLNSIETSMSQALMDIEISHKEFKTIVYEKEKYNQVQESIKN